MATDTPEVRGGTLYQATTAAAPAVCELDTSAWFAWLEIGRTFSARLPNGGHMTCYRRKSRNIYYWYASIKNAGKTYNAYLGKPGRVTGCRLSATARRLVAQTRPGQAPETAQPAGF